MLTDDESVVNNDERVDRMFNSPALGNWLVRLGCKREPLLSRLGGFLLERSGATTGQTPAVFVTVDTMNRPEQLVRRLYCRCLKS